MDIPTHAALLDRIEAFRARNDIAETRFGREAVGNPNFIAGLKKDPPVSPTLETLNKVKEYMERTDEEARVRAKLDAPLDALPAEEVEQPLPFSQAPVNTTGASSPTSSSTPEPPTPLPASDRSCPSCSSPDRDAA